MELSNLSIVLLGACGMLVLATGIVLFVLQYQRKVIRHKQQINTINITKEKELTEAAIHAEEE